MSEIAYTTVIGKISPFLSKIREVGVPSSANTKWLPLIGFKSTNDRGLLKVMKFINLIGANGKPTENWSKYRGENYKKVLAKCIKEGFNDLFRLYPDANLRSDSDLRNYFSQNTTAGSQVIQKMIATFKTLCENADFDGSLTEKKETKTNALEKPKIQEQDEKREEIMNTSFKNPVVHIDLQIHISPESSASQIDKIFESISKHLIKE